MNCSCIRAACGWQLGFSPLPIVNYVFPADTAENCEFVNYICFFLWPSICSHVSLHCFSFLDDCFRLYWRRDAENERFRFNVSCSFPRWPLKVWRTVLDVRCVPIQFLSSTREMASSRERHQRQLSVFACVCWPMTTATTIAMHTRHPDPSVMLAFLSSSC